MKGKKAALSWSIIHSIGDSLEEQILLKYDENLYLFKINLITGIFVLIYSIFGGIEMSFLSFVVLIIYSLAIIGGGFLLC